jgi:hypothetical protein
MAQEQPVVAVIADIVGSRRAEDRSAAQLRVEETLEAVASTVPALRDLRPTVGDEFQGVYASLEGALRAVLVVRLFLPDGLDCRFGLGSGRAQSVSSTTRDDLQDGSAWWAARRAVDVAHGLQAGRGPTARSWFSAGEDAEDHVLHSEGLVNAFLLSRDEILTGMTERNRIIARRLFQGARQTDIAAELGISQSAVSKVIRHKGVGSLIHGARLLESER